MPHLRIE